MTRAQLLKSLKSRISYYGKQGYVFEDLEPDKLSTQKLKALHDVKARAFLEKTKPVYITTSSPTVTTYEQQKAQRLQQAENERLRKRLNERVRKYAHEGYETQDLSRLDIAQMNAKELRRISKLSREGLLKEFGTSYTFAGGAPGQEREISITAKQQLEIEAALKKAKAAAKKHGTKTPGRQTFSTEQGREKYLDYLQKMAAPGYYDERDERYIKNYLDAVRAWKGIDPELDYIASEIEKLPKTVILAKLKIMAEQGFEEFTPINYFDSQQNVYSTRKGSLYNLFGIDRQADNGESPDESE